MADFSDSKKSISEYNEAGFQIMRLHNLWLDSNNYARQGNYLMWRWTLDRIWVELSADAKNHRSKEKYYKENELCNLRIQKSKSKDQQYFSLIKKEEFLKSLQDDVGKGSKRTETYEEIM